MVCAMLSLPWVAGILPMPLLAQETKQAAMRHCPYCGIANGRASKFCGACGSKLPARSFSTNLPARNDAKLKRSDNEFDFQPETATEKLVGAGLMAGAIGFFAGGFLGADIDKAGSDGYEEWDGLAGFIIGAPIGESLLLPVGVHLANGRRGNFPLSLLASVGIAGAGIFAAAAAEEPYMLLSIPILQLAACTAIERSTGQSR
jgi:hypothetical protein